MAIDLFTDAFYGTIAFEPIHEFFSDHFTYVDTNPGFTALLGKSWYVGANQADAVKVDLYYTDAYIFPEKVEEGVRMASLEEIIAMKLEVIAHRGRKKDYWDLHQLHQSYSISQMIALYSERYPYGYDEEEIRKALVRFATADDDLDPICLFAKNWELIKLEFTQWTLYE